MLIYQSSLLKELLVYSSNPVFSTGFKITVYIAVTLVSVFILRFLIRLLVNLSEDSVFLELTPPASTAKSSYTTQQLFSVIYNLGRQRALIEKLIGKKSIFSCELVSSQDKGIRYIVKTSSSTAVNLQRSIISYLPDIKVSTVKDYFDEKAYANNTFRMVIEFNLSKPFLYPLKKQNILEEHDPVAYIAGMMTKLSTEELISFQIVLSPTKHRESTIIKHKILKNEDILGYLDSKSTNRFLLMPITLLKAIFSATNWSLSTLVQDLNSLRRSHQYLPAGYATERMISTFEQNFMKTIEEKVDLPLFETRIRLYLGLKSADDLNQRIKGFTSSLGVFSSPLYQYLKRVYLSTIKLFNWYYQLSFRYRLLSLISNSSATILSISEVADLYHFPFARVTQTENIVKIHSKELPAPLSLKQSKDLDIVFAKNNYGGTTTMIGLSQDERRRHMYVIGATGSGKTTMLLSMIEQDIKHGKGVCVVDPHGDLAETIIDCIPAERINDLIYFNPYDIKYPIGINLLELTSGLDEDEALIEKEFIAESVISLFRKMFSDSGSGHPHRIEYILRNTIHTAFTVESPTLFTIFELLNNPSFQKKTVQNLKDENLKNFWKYEFGKAGDYQQVKMTAPVTSRIGRFLFSPSAKRILEQEKSTINFDEILDTNKLLICNLSKGSIGEDTSEVMGIMILNKIQLAALKRSRREKRLRNDYYLYVDEFQNFATPSFVQMLSESRKYGLNLTIAEQSTSQQNDRNLTHVILANVGTVVGFRSANPVDEDLLLRQFSPYVDKGEIANLQAYHFYMKTSALHPEEPFSGETMPLNLKLDKDFRHRLIEASREHHAMLYTQKNEVKNIDEKKTNQKKKEDRPITQQSVFPED